MALDMWLIDYTIIVNRHSSTRPSSAMGDYAHQGSWHDNENAYMRVAIPFQ
jgi:hypothetical protein